MFLKVAGLTAGGGLSFGLGPRRRRASELPAKTFSPSIVDLNWKLKCGDGDDCGSQHSAIGDRGRRRRRRRAVGAILYH